MGFGLRFLIVIFSIFLIGCNFSSGKDTEIISLPQGDIVGFAKGDTDYFLGIPYAEPPIGTNRFEPPKSHKGWSDVLKAKEAEKQCMQPQGEEGELSEFFEVFLTKSGMKRWEQIILENAAWLFASLDFEKQQSEDCLFINIIKPSKIDNASLPVMVWVHGGGYNFGNGDGLYITDRFAKRDVILVTMNYRLGPFGFFAHPLLSETSKMGVSGNYGTLDQIAALKWVKDNIANFGGDPNNITIFGESAGGQAVTSLMISPLSKGLFHKAIAQSGTGLPNVLTDIREDKGLLVSAESKGIKLAKYFLGENANINDLRELPALEIVSIDDFQLDQDLIMMTNQIVDGYVFPESIKDAFINQNVHDLPFMVGFNGDEGTSLFPLIIDPKTFSLFGEFWPESLWAFVNPDPSSFQGPKGMRDFALSLDDNYYDAATDFWGFLFFGAPSYFVAKQHSLSGNPTYLYQFDKKPNIPNNYLGATHALELGYLFNKGGLFGIEGSYDDSDITLAQQMRADWIHFAKKGFLPDANAFNHEESIARIYDQVISDQIIEHHSFYKSYSSYWENLQ